MKTNFESRVAGTKGSAVGVLGTVLGLLAGLFLLFGPFGRYETATTGGSSESGTTSGVDYLLGAQHADPALFFWSVVLLGVSVVSSYAAWSGNRVVVWVVGLGLLALSVLGMMTIGLFVAPAAICFLVSGALLSVGRRDD